MKGLDRQVTPTRNDGILSIIKGPGLFLLIPFSGLLRKSDTVGRRRTEPVVMSICGDTRTTLDGCLRDEAPQVYDSWGRCHY